jgi:hypothetical protein
MSNQNEKPKQTEKPKPKPIVMKMVTFSEHLPKDKKGKKSN